VSAADYWIAVNFADGTPVITYDADGPQSFLGTNTYSAGSLPGTYPGGGSSADRTYSMYCTYTASGGGSSFIPAIINAPKRGGGFHALRRR
jgi:hypothetical protein